MEDPTWSNPSQSFGYAMPSKTPFTSNAQVSPTKSGSYRLRWHNSVAEDYSFSESMGPLKRSASMALPEAGIDYPDQLLDSNSTTPPPRANLQTKKRKQSISSSIVSTPLRSKHVDAAFNATATTGMQTPPPTNPTTKRRRGRPPKNPPNEGASQLDFVNEPATSTGTESHDTTPSRAAEYGTHSSPSLQQADSFLMFPNQGGHLDSNDFQASGHWDTSFAGSFMAENNMASSFASGAGEVDIFSATAAFDWSMIPTTMGDPTMSMHSVTDSFYNDPTHLDPLNFSFAQDPLSASDIISPGSVDPNLIFSGQSAPQHYNVHLGEQVRSHKRKEQVGSSRSQAPTVPKVAIPVPPKRPVAKRALTESALTKLGGSSKASNVTLRPSPMKQMGSLSGKTRPAIKDENTTPSPVIGSGSVPQVSPESNQSRRGSRKAKTTVSFSISPGGRAKVEKVLVPDSDPRRLDNEVPEEGDSDSSTDEDDFETHLPRYAANARSKGHHSKSSLNRSMERPKLARFRTAPGSFSASSQFLMSGDFTSDSFNLENNPFLPHNMSMSSFEKSPRRKSSHSRRHSKNSSFHSVRSGVASNVTLGSMHEEEEYSETETVIDEPTTYKTAGDAILALKQAVAARRHSANRAGGPFQRPPSSYGTSRPSTRHTNFVPSSPPMQQQYPPYGFSTPQTVGSGYSSDPFISPTTVTDPDCVTPSTYGGRHFGSRQDDVAIDLRCRCGSAGSPEMPVLQCNACFKWLHVQCEGYSHRPIPSTLVCSFCKGGWQGPQPSQRVFRKPSLPQTISPLEARSFSA